MFNIESIVDTVKGAQTSFVETYVTDKTIQKSLVKLLESQAAFAKSSYKSTLELAETVAKYATDYSKSAIAKKAGV